MSFISAFAKTFPTADALVPENTGGGWLVYSARLMDSPAFGDDYIVVLGDGNGGSDLDTPEGLEHGHAAIFHAADWGNGEGDPIFAEYPADGGWLAALTRLEAAFTAN